MDAGTEQANAAGQTSPTADGSIQAEQAESKQDDLRGIAAIEAELAEDSVNDVEALAEEADSFRVGDWAKDLPEALMRFVDVRVSVWMKLDDIEKKRAHLQTQTTMRQIRDELGRQSRELQKCPGAEIIEKALTRQKEMLKRPELKGDVPPPSAKDKEPPPDPQVIFKQALGLGVTQLTLLQQRLKLDAAIIAAGMQAAGDEPLLKICQAHGLDAQKLFGLCYYALGLLVRINHFKQIEDDYRRRLSAARAEDKQNKGLKTVFRGKTKENELEPLDETVVRTLQAARRELQAVEPMLTESYWALYEDLAWLLANGKVAEDQQPTVRAYLRYGLVSTHQGMIEPSLVEYILNDCTRDVYTFENRTDSTHVLYADEFISLITKGKIIVSPDEDLELNSRGGKEWKADRVWRQAVVSRTRHELVKHRLEQLNTQIEQMQSDADRKQAQSELWRSDPKKKAKANELEQEVAILRPTIGRLRNAAEHLQERVIPKLSEQESDSTGKLAEESRVLTPEMVARREARFVRYMARLSARLKEPFPQFVLRDHFEPHKADHHSRTVVLDQLNQLERNDQYVFHQTLVPNKRLDRQITVRMSPVFLVTPGRGQMGLAISPRKWDDNGRMTLPLLSQKPGALEGMLINLLADFRWDCSKEEAGMDWIVADALCAGYAAVRWNVRKLPEKARKAMGFDPKLKDKPNWRIHYALFVTSAEQQGRLLFSKCDEVYKVMLKYLGLPPGVEPLKRD